MTVNQKTIINDVGPKREHKVKSNKTKSQIYFFVKKLSFDNI
jgi:hypothetical protein